MRVIYIDDDTTNRTVVKDMLRPSGMLMDGAESVQTGLQMISAGDYQAVLIDLRMPGVNGVTGIRQVRARADAKGRLPIIVVSGEMSDGVRQLCAQAGADHFLEKPVSMSQLLLKVGAAIAKGGDVMLV